MYVRLPYCVLGSINLDLQHNSAAQWPLFPISAYTVQFCKTCRHFQHEWSLTKVSVFSFIHCPRTLCTYIQVLI